MAIGKTGSFATVEAPQDNIMQAMQYVDQLDYRAKQDRGIQEAAKVKKVKEDEDALAKNLEKFKNTTTGVYTIDNVTNKTMAESRDMYADNARRLSNLNIPKEERYRLMAENDKLLQNVTTTSETAKLFNDKQAEIADNISKGIYNPNDEKDLEEWSKSLSNVDVRIENGIVLFSSYEKDEQGNIKRVVMDDADMSTVLKQMDRFKKSNYDDFKESFYKNNPLNETDIQSGFTTYKDIKVTPEKLKNAQKAAKVISTSDDEMYQKWYEMTGEKKRSWNDEERQKVEEYVTTDLISGYKITKGVDIDQSGITGRMNSLKEDKEKKAEYTLVETPPSYGAAGIESAPGYKTISIDPENQITVPHITGLVNGEEQNYNNAILNSYTVVKDKKGVRSIVAEITYPDVKTSTLTADEKITFEKFESDPESLNNDEKLVVSRIVKGVENKTKVVRMNEKNIVKFKKSVGASDANGMKDLARTGEEQKLDEYGVPIN